MPVAITTIVRNVIAAAENGIGRNDEELPFVLITVSDPRLVINIAVVISELACKG